MNYNENVFMWTEKAKPMSIEDMILPEEIKRQINEWIEKGHCPNLLLSSTSPGLGKTSLGDVLSNELNAETKLINASLENGIDTIRNKVMEFASSCSFDGDPKIVIMDEADNMSASSQSAWRGFLDEFSKNCIFIFTCNYKDKIIEPLRNRLVKFDFDDIFIHNKKELGKQIIIKLFNILDKENIKYDKSDLKNVLLNLYPSIRDMIMYIQKHSVNGVLEIDNNVQKSAQYNVLIECIKDKDFTKLRQQVSNLTSPDSFYTWCWKNLDLVLEAESHPKAILIIAKYQFQSAMAVDAELNLAACTTELLGSCLRWKE